MNKKKIIISIVLVAISCSLVSILFRYKVMNRNNDIKQEELNAKERFEQTLKQDEIAPVLILSRDKIVMYIGDELNYKSFIEEASDNLEGDLISKVKYEKIDTSKAGEFYVYYEVSDKALNTTKARLKVIVKEKPVFKN